MDTVRALQAMMVGSGPVGPLDLLLVVGCVLAVAYLLWACYVIVGGRNG